MCRKPPRTPSRNALVAGVVGLLLSVSQVATLVVAADSMISPLDIIYESDEVRIYRMVRPNGQRAVVLTNLDAEGRRMGGEIPAFYRRTSPIVRRAAESLPSPDEALPVTSDYGAGGATPAPDVQVIVNRGDGSQDAVRVTPSGDGTTVIINIDVGAPQAPPPVPVVFAPIAAVGGVPGPVRYPDHHHFLGYGHNNSAPGLFGGLGLNASNGYGISKRPCGNGFDCMLGPQREHP